MRCFNAQNTVISRKPGLHCRSISHTNRLKSQSKTKKYPIRSVLTTSNVLYIGDNYVSVQMFNGNLGTYIWLHITGTRLFRFYSCYGDLNLYTRSHYEDTCLFVCVCVCVCVCDPGITHVVRTLICLHSCITGTPLPYGDTEEIPII